MEAITIFDSMTKKDIEANNERLRAEIKREQDRLNKAEQMAEVSKSRLRVLNQELSKNYDKYMNLK